MKLLLISPHMQSITRLFLLLLAALPSFAGVLSGQTHNLAGDGKIDMIVVRDRIDVFSSATGGRKIGERTDCAFEVLLVGTGGFHEETPTGAIPQLIEAYTEEGDRIGFIRPEDVIYNRREALFAEREETGEVSSLYRKALIVTDYEDLTPEVQRELQENEILDSNGKRLVRVRGLRDPELGPGAENVQKQVFLYDPYYVWAERTIGGREWWLLSTAQRFSSLTTEKVRKSMVGWLPADRVYRWDTRQAIEYDWETRRRRIAATGGTVENPRDAGAIIFKNEMDAKRHLLNVGGLRPEAMAREEMRLVILKEIREGDEVRIERESGYIGDDPLPYHTARYPLLESRESSRAAGPIYRIGFIGGVYGPEGMISRQTLDNFRRIQQQLARSKLQLDLVLVIDATKSMEKYRNDSIRAAQQIVELVKAQAPEEHEARFKDSDLLTRVSICVYRNKEDGDDSFDRMPFVDANSSWGRSQIEEFLGRIPFRSVSDNPREAVYAGIERAVEECAAEQDTNPDAYRMMVLIGDAGDDSPGVDAADVV